MSRTQPRLRRVDARPVLRAAFWLAVAAAAQAGPPLDAATRAQLLTLDPEQVGEREVRERFSKAPAPQILLFQGSVVADMESFGAFLRRMGYPDERLRNPQTGAYSYRLRWNGCACEGCDRLAQRIASGQAPDGLAPMLVGHSGGGVSVSRVLYRLAELAPPTAEHDTVRVPFAATLATGALLRWVPGFPGCAADVSTLGDVPASVQDFSGFRIAGDPLTALFGFGDYRALAAGPVQARVRNVVLSAKVSHVGAFEVDGYAEQPAVRAWIEAYRPGMQAPLPQAGGLDLANLPHVAALWYEIKKHWALQARCWAQPRRDSTERCPAP